MKNQHKSFIRKKIVNILVITVITFLIGVTYLGFYKAKIAPIEIVKDITLTIKN
jgi:hypothetical protein